MAGSSDKRGNLGTEIPEFRQISPLGRAIRYFRSVRGLTQEQLANAAFIATTTISDVERGKTQLPSALTLAAIAKGLGITSTELWAAVQEYEEGQTAGYTDAINRFSNVEQSSLGARFHVVDDQLVIAPSGQEEDEAAARSPMVRALHEQVLRKAQNFLPVVQRLSNQLGWDGIAPALERFLSYLGGDTSDVAARIGDVWGSAVELGSYLELDQRLQTGATEAISPLDPEVRRQFSDLIRVAAPFVRQFPTAKMLDDESGAFLSRSLFLESAGKVLQQATSAALVSDKDRQLLQALVEAAERGDFQGTKAQSRVCSSAKNLVLAGAGIVATFYMGSVASHHSDLSPIAKKAAEAIVTAEKPIIKLFEDAPADIRAALEALIQHIKADHDQAPGVPSPSRVAMPSTERRRRHSLLEAILFEKGWKLNFRPHLKGRIKRISFNKDGTIGEGQNVNEHGWRWNGDKLELIRRDGSVHNRFEYDPVTDKFISNQPSAIHNIHGQFIYRD